MNKKQFCSIAVLTGGVLELVIAFVHFIWPSQLVKTGEFANLSMDYQNLVVLLCLSVGLCLTTFGILSIIAARGVKIAESWAWLYGMSQGILWLIRMLFEVIFPVRIPLFFVNTPTVFVLPFSLLLGLLYLLPLLLFRKEFIGTRNRV